MKKSFYSLLALICTTSLFAQNISKQECNTKGDDFIFAGGECIEYKVFEGENEAINIIVHGTWPDGANTLGRYGPFAETINFNTDLTTIAVALPGYSGSSTNNFTALAHEGVKNLGAKKEYIEFLGDLVQALKDKYEAKSVNYLGHSAGAMMGGTLMGLRPGLITNAQLVGGRYDIQTETGNKELISMANVINEIDKDSNYVLVYGTEDKISKPKTTIDFYDVMKKNGLNATLVEVKGAEHVDLDMTTPSVEAFTELVSQ